MIDRGIGRCRRGMAASAVIGLVLGLGLVGCDDANGDPPDSGLPSEDEVTTEPSTSPSTTPTPSEPAAPEPPTIPAAATKGGHAGAKAFVEFYIDLLNYARHTGDVERLQQYSHPECGGCGDFVRFYREWYKRGGWFKDGDRTIKSFDRVVPTVPPNDMYVRVSGLHLAGTEREHRSGPIRHAGRERFTLLMWLVRSPDGWRASGLDDA